MNQTTIETLQKAQELIRAGNKQQACDLLMPMVRADQNLAEAWYLLGFALADLEKRKFAFEQVLRIDPSNQAAQKQIARISARSSAPIASAVNRKAQKKAMQTRLAWGYAGIAGLFLCLIFALGWWVSRSGVPAFKEALPTWTQQHTHPTLKPTLTPGPTFTHTRVPSKTLPPTLSSTPTQPAQPTWPTLKPHVNPTSRATPNLNIFKPLPTPLPGVTQDVGAMLAERPALSYGTREGNLTESQSGHLDADETISLTIDVDGNGRTNFNLQWIPEDKNSQWAEKDAPEFTLIAPNGQLIDQAYVSDHPSEGTFSATPFYGMLSYVVNQAETGTWTLNMTASQAGNYRVFAVLTSSLVLDLGSSLYSLKSGSTATFMAYLRDDKDSKDAGVADATISLELVLPDISTETVFLQNYGNGVYAIAYDIPALNGFLTVTATAKGVYNGKNFTRQAFLILEIDPNDIKLTGEHADRMTEQDGDKTLDVEVGIDSARVGKFSVGAQLISDGEIIATTNQDASFTIGHNLVTLQFQGRDIRYSRLDGPYTINILSISDWGSGTYMQVANNTWQTASYHWRDFGPEFCYSLVTKIDPSNAGSIAISPAPNCPNGQYLSGTKLTLTAKANAGFKFKGWFADAGEADESALTITFTLHMDQMRATAFFEKAP